MKIRYNLDIDEKSASYAHTPGEAAKNLPFYIDTVGHFYANAGYYTEREGYESYLLLYTLRGCGFVKSKEDMLFLPRDQVALIYCGDYQQYRTQGEAVWEFRWIHFNGRCAAEYFNRLNSEGFCSVSMVERAEFGRRFAELDDMIADAGNMPDLRISQQMTLLLTDLILSKNSPSNNRMYLQHKREIAHAVEFVRENYSRAVTVDDIADTARFSKYYFIRIFKSFTGQNPYEYLVHYRINASKKLLIETALPVNEIAARCGFSDSNHYIRAFKRATGATPLQYRNFWSE